MSNLVIIDTSVFVDHLRTGCHQERIASLTGLIRTSAVVLAELWRGATKPAEKSIPERAGKKPSPHTDSNGEELAGVGSDIIKDAREPRFLT